MAGIRGLGQEACWDHRLEDNDILATYVRLCWLVDQKGCWPVLEAGITTLRQITAVARGDRALVVLTRMHDLGLLKLEAATGAGDAAWTITLSAE